MTATGPLWPVLLPGVVRDGDVFCIVRSAYVESGRCLACPHLEGTALGEDGSLREVLCRPPLRALQNDLD